MKPEVIALVDCNSFFCSCERVFRPDLKNKPIVVLSNNDGCAVSRTPEAIALGVKMGEPYFKFKNLCQTKDLKVFSANFSLYTNFSDRVMNTLKKLSPSVEIYSVDEAFVDISGFGDPYTFGKLIKDRVERDTAIPVGIGIGTTKVLAKAANRLVKKVNGHVGVLSLVDVKDREKYLKELAIEDVWGIGRANTPKMRSLGIRSAQDLVEYKNEKQIQKLFTQVGLNIKHELMGIACIEFNKPVEPKKEIMCSRSFGATISDLQTLKQVIANYVTNAAEKLRAQDSTCQEITVFAQTNPFNQSDQYYLNETLSLPAQTLDTRKLIKYAHQLLEKGFKQGYEYKKAGIRLSGFYTSCELQMDIFGEQDSLDTINLMHAIDRINARNGEIIVKTGACGVSGKAWKMNQDHKSPRYTTSWSELAEFR